jgi:hypothetical protein
MPVRSRADTELPAECRELALEFGRGPAANVYGVDVAVTPVWQAGAGDAIVGGWPYLVIGIREDIRFETSTDAILQDATGAIVVNSLQDDMVAMRCFLRMGAAIGRPVGLDGQPVSPFSVVDWTAVAARRRRRGGEEVGRGGTPTGRRVWLPRTSPGRRTTLGTG